jgi:5-methylcytosine-specific restriction protein A
MPSRPPVHRPAYYNPEHVRQQQLKVLDLRRGSASSRGYDAAWKRLRLVVLDEHPLCARCQTMGRVTVATEVHHKVKVRNRPDLRLDRSVLECLCKPCHSAETAQGR